MERAEENKISLVCAMLLTLSFILNLMQAKEIEKLKLQLPK
jgi:hypothetical protein